MPEETKITLSPKELSMVSDKDWILTKRAIIEKVFVIFGEMIPVIQRLVGGQQVPLPDIIQLTEPKIFKGENYLDLPYVMLDYPRYFKGEEVFAIRTMFWWGNFFSITLHLSGDYCSLYRNKLLEKINLMEADFYIGVNEDQWQHHFDSNNFIHFQQMSPSTKMERLQKENFIKLALKFDLQQWNDIPQILEAGYEKIFSLLD